MNSANEIKFPGFTLVSVTNPTATHLDELIRRLHLGPIDLAEAGSPAKRTWLETHPQYVRLVTLWPTYRKSSRDIRPAELSFFLRPEVLLVLQRGELPAFAELIHQYAASAELREHIRERTPERLLYLLMSYLYQSLFPMINHLIDDCDAIEHEIFSSRERHLISQILAIRRNITDVRKILQVHKSVLRRLATYLTADPRFAMSSRDRYFNDLIDYAREDWDVLENLKERIEALQQTNESQISFRMSDIMKTLTIISVFTFPLTLVAALFSVIPASGMPFAGRAGGFWYLIGLEALVAGLMFFIFKRKRWF